MAARYSIKQQLDGATVLLTGGTGYLGSLLLEQVLRTTDVRRVYVLLRDRRGQDAHTRLAKLLSTGLFHMVRSRPDLVAKVVVVKGDVTAPGLGLSAADHACVQQEVQLVIHSAASIELEADVHATLRANFLGTLETAALAAECAQLRAFVHISSAYVNINLPLHAVVHERVYGLHYGDQPIDTMAVAQELLALPPKQANVRASGLLARWGFPNTYCLGKHMAEQALLEVAHRTGLPLAIVRPSFVTSVARLPYPGYFGNFAGPIGLGAALAVGMVPHANICAGRPTHVWDTMPGDVVASVVLATAAALAAGAAPAMLARANAARAACCPFGSVPLVPFVPPVSWAAPEPGTEGGLVAAAEVARAAAGTGVTGMGGGVPAAPAAAHARPAAAMPAGAAATAAAGGASTGLMAAAAAAPGLAGAAATAAATAAAGAAAAPAARQRGRVMIVHACTGTTYPVTLREAYNDAVEFVRAHPPPFRLTVGKPSQMKASWMPRQELVARHTQWSATKVKVVSRLLNMVGATKAARRLTIGMKALEIQNRPEYDKDLRFATHNLLELEAGLDPRERDDFLLVWRSGHAPVRNGLGTADSTSTDDASAAVAALSINGSAMANGMHHTSPAPPNGFTADHMGNAHVTHMGNGHMPNGDVANSYVGTDDATYTGVKLASATANAKSIPAAAAAAVAGAVGPAGVHPIEDIDWRRYSHTTLASIYKVMFGVDLSGKRNSGKAGHNFVYVP